MSSAQSSSPQPELTSCPSPQEMWTNENGESMVHQLSVHCHGDILDLSGNLSKGHVQIVFDDGLTLLAEPRNLLIHCTAGHRPQVHE